MNTEINNKETEQRELDKLIDRGEVFEVPMKSFLRWFSKRKTRRFTIYQPYNGTLDYLADCFIKMEVDEQQLQENPVKESNRIVRRSAKIASRTVAIAVLNSKWKINLFANLLTAYFHWRLKPSTLLQLVLTIKLISNYGDFISSIRLMSGTRRETQPKADLIEAEQTA